MSYYNKIKNLYEMIGQGQAMDAFNKYYAERVEVVEGDGTIRSGKEAQRQALVGWMDSIEASHGGGTTKITADEGSGVTMVECWFDNTFKGAGRMKMEEIAVQQWEDDQIVHERFYYNVPGK